MTHCNHSAEIKTCSALPTWLECQLNCMPSIRHSAQWSCSVCLSLFVCVISMNSSVLYCLPLVCPCQASLVHTLITQTLNLWVCLPYFYRASICEGVLGSRNSVRPSVTRVYCDKTKWRTADILIPHGRAITLLLWYQQWLMGDAPFPLISALKVTYPLRKTPTSTDFRS